METIANTAKSELILGASLVLLAVGAYTYYYNMYSYWERRGVKGPRPMPLVGNLHSLLLGDRPTIENQWRDKYGKVYGIFLASGARLTIADPEVLRQIAVKDFGVFSNHHLDELSDKYSKSSVFFLQDDHWKRVRALMSPTFTSAKIKRMFMLIDRCADDLVQLLGDQLASSDVVNVKELYHMFTMDTITTCCYGLRLERTGSTNLETAATRNEFVRLAMRLFDFKPFRLMTAAIVPKAILKFVGFNINPESNSRALANKVLEMITKRKTSNQKFDDYLQMLLEAKLEDRLELGDSDLQENHHAGLTHESLQADQQQMADEVRGKSNGTDSNGTVHRNRDILSAHEIISNAVFLLFVGLETTATLLAHCSYALAFHQDTQERLYEELHKIAEYNGDKSSLTFDYEKLTACRYLDSVISETLRLLTPIIALDREVASDYYLEKYNINLQKGSVVHTAYHAIHTDPDSWEDPEKFNPERFMPGNREKIVPGSYCPFGMGPRHCLGMRFSLTEAKLGLAKIMMKYRFERVPGTKFPPQCKTTFFLYIMATPFVRITART